MEGSDGLRSLGALYGEITLKDGKVEQSNFNDYPVVRMNEMPVVEVHLVKIRREPAGLASPHAADRAGSGQCHLRADRPTPSQATAREASLRLWIGVPRGGGTPDRIAFRAVLDLRSYWLAPLLRAFQAGALLWVAGEFIQFGQLFARQR